MSSAVVGDFICTSRNFLSQGFRSLPVLLGGSLLFLGLVQGNFNLLFFFTGMFILVPMAAILANGLWEFVFTNVPSWLQIPPEFWQISGANAEACTLFTVGASLTDKAVTMNTVPTFWMSMMAFFFTYLFSNALKLYNLQEQSKAPKHAVNARKSQAVISMMIVVGVAIVTTLLRYATTCETFLGILVSWGVGGALGYSWYEFMRNCGLGRLDDLFGISNRILPLQSYEEEQPTVCVPTATSDT